MAQVGILYNTLKVQVIMKIIFWANSESKLNKLFKHMYKIGHIQNDKTV